MRKFNKIFIFTVILILLSTTIVLAEGSPKATESTWVYDKTNSLSEETIQYITSLNEGELSGHQYAVYITDTIDKDMDSYKLDLFNKLEVGNKELNSGVLFVLATKDREYGIEIGDGFTGTQRRTFEEDIVRNVALSELKEGDWDGAVLKVSREIERMIVNGSDIEIARDEVNNFLDNNQGSIFSTVIMAIFTLIVGSVITQEIFSDISWSAIKFRRGEEYNSFMYNNGFDKKALKKEIDLKNYNFDTNGLYELTLDKTTEIISKKTRSNVDRDIIKSLFTLDEYIELKSRSIIYISNIVSQDYEAYLKEEKKKLEKHNALVNKNLEYLDDMLIDLEVYSADKIKVIKEELSITSKQPETKKELSEWLNENLKLRELKKQLNNMFSPSEAKDILADLRRTGKYNTFIKGEDLNFNNSSNNNYSDVSIANGVNPAFMWLWIYGVARNRRVEDDNRRYEDNRRREQERRDREDTDSNNHSNFGGGFGGGFSSGGGSSGGF